MSGNYNGYVGMLGTDPFNGGITINLGATGMAYSTNVYPYFTTISTPKPVMDKVKGIHISTTKNGVTTTEKRFTRVSSYIEDG